jgi:uncharacterized protein
MGDAWFALVATGSATDVSAAIKAGADVHELDASGWSSVAVAAAMNPDADVIVVLLAAGANPTTRVGNFQWTPLMVATMSTPNPQVVHALLDTGSDLHARDTRGFTALHNVIGWHPYRHARPYLLDTHTVDAIVVDGDRMTLSEPFTSHTGLYEATFYYPQFGFEMSARIVALEDSGTTLRFGQPLSHGLRLEGIELTTPRVAWPAAATGTSAISMAHLLIEAGADPNVRNGMGDTVLTTAAGLGAPSTMLQLLLEAGADVNSRSDSGATALIAASAAHTVTPEMLRVLIDAGAEVNARTDRGWTALMFAAAESVDPEVLRLLIDTGADVNARGGIGNRTILMHAAILNRNPEVLRFLLEAGADATIVDQTGRRAIDYARTNDYLRGTDAYWQLNDASFD